MATGPATQLLDVPGGQVAYDVTGDGLLVVCAPGMGDLRTAYRFLVPHLVAAGYRVATMDLRGHGRSSTGWPTYSQTAIGADLVALIRHLGGPAAIVGHSYTPDAALVAAAEAPGDVAGTVLVAPWATRPTPGPIMALLTKAVTRSPALWGLFYRSINKGPKPPDLRQHVAAIRTNLREPGRTAALAAMTDPAAVDAEPHRERAAQPALIVMGSVDPDFKDPAAEARAMQNALGGPAEIAIIDGAGHYPHAQCPDGTAAAVVPFLERVLGG